MTTKDAVFRELKYALAGAGGSLEDLVAQDHIKMDVRITVSSSQSDSDYPWLIFRRVFNSEDNQVRFSRDRYEFVLIGRQMSATKGDDLLEEIREALIDHFAGRTKTWGKYEANGDADADGGLRMKASYLESTEDVDQERGEKLHMLTFSFTHVRE